MDNIPKQIVAYHPLIHKLIQLHQVYRLYRLNFGHRETKVLESRRDIQWQVIKL